MCLQRVLDVTRNYERRILVKYLVTVLVARVSVNFREVTGSRNLKFTL